MEMETAQVIEALGALAQEHRLAIFRLLVVHGPGGLPAGRIAERIGLVPSSLTFHLQALQRAGLITQRRESRQLYYAPDFSTLSATLDYLSKNCCAASGETCSTGCLPAKPEKAAKRASKAA
jgi:ArsR family transcriptional regulator